MTCGSPAAHLSQLEQEMVAQLDVLGVGASLVSVPGWRRDRRGDPGRDRRPGPVLLKPRSGAADECAVPEGFRLAAYWQVCQADFRERPHRGDAEIRVAPGAGHWLREPTARAVAQAGIPEADGWARAVVSVESVADTCREFLALGAHPSASGCQGRPSCGRAWRRPPGSRLPGSRPPGMVVTDGTRPDFFYLDPLTGGVRGSLIPWRS
jgi:hypothetical protein